MTTIIGHFFDVLFPSGALFRSGKRVCVEIAAAGEVLAAAVAAAASIVRAGTAGRVDSNAAV